jgi:hypothetical protein
MTPVHIVETSAVMIQFKISFHVYIQRGKMGLYKNILGSE